MAKQVQTVMGPIDVDAMGVTQAHEHLYQDCRYLYERADPKRVYLTEKVTAENRKTVMTDLQTVLYKYGDNTVFEDTDMIIDELMDFKAAGGQTIFEVSTVDLGRDPWKLRRIAEKTGLNIVMGSTYYHFPSLPPQTQELILNKGVNGMADLFIRELEEGVAGSGIRPGVLGEIGPVEGNAGTDIVFHAAAIASRETGVPAIIHYATMDTLRIFEEEGADPSKVVMGHWGLEFPVDEAIRHGAMISFDQFGMNFPGIKSDEERLREVVVMMERGYEDRLILSQDMCWKIRLRSCGGDGYGHLQNTILPKLKEMGVTDAQIHKMMVENVKTLFA
ncbi:MAG: hypothetical protein J6K98_03620 [Clostridia bacterium]|nr:hypothetical protein [Clostridia bacterium]